VTHALVSRPCPLCGDGAGRVLFLARDLNARAVDGEFPVVRCDCGMGYLSRVPKDLAAAYPSDYDAHASRPALQALSRRFNLIRKLRPGRIVDVGCGSGRDLLTLRDCGWTVVGVETDPHAAAAAVAAGIDVRAGTLETAGLEPDSADVVTMFHVLEHVTDPVDVFRRARQALRPGGVLLAHVPNFEGWAARLFRGAWYALDVPRHVNFFGARTIDRALHQGGLVRSLLRNRPAPGDWRRSLHLSRGFRLPSPAARAVARTACLFRGGDVLELLAARP
jgi:SAM-dependent methyltransferase